MPRATRPQHLSPTHPQHLAPSSPQHALPGQHRLPRHAAAVLALTLAITAASVGVVVAAHALSPATAGLAPISHPDADHAGSSLAARGGFRPVVPITASGGQTRGLDVSAWQGNVNWSAARSKGARFAYIKATEATSYVNRYFAQQYNGSYQAGLIRGAYHFALPDRSSGAAQANYFVSHGGGWSADGMTLPPVLDIEYNPYGSQCYGLSHSAMVSWVRAFSNQVRARAGRYPVIYSTADWWRSCTGNSASFASTNPLWIARYAGSAGTLPAGWSFYTFWQYSDGGTFPGDQDVFNGSLSRLKVLASH